MMKELSTNEILTNHLQIHFIELSKYKDIITSKVSLTKNLSTWFLFFKSSDLDKDINSIISLNPIMEDVMDKYRSFTADELIQDQILRRNMFKSDQATLLSEARKEGLQKGIEEGLHNKAIEMAKNMKKDGVDIKTIVKYSGLSKEEIEKL